MEGAPERRRVPPLPRRPTMKSLRVAGLATLTLLSILRAPAGATTAQETFNKLIAKFAPDETSLSQNFKPKVGCGCVSNQLPGFVLLDGVGHVNCGLPQFNPDGSLVGFFFCNGDFVVLH